MAQTLEKPNLILIATGAECCGKTTLCKDLSEKFDIDYCMEYARAYLEKNGPGYTEKDVLKMAKVQLQREQVYLFMKRDVHILDTNLLTYKIWLLDKFNRKGVWIKDALETYYNNALYLLCDYEIPYDNDPLREDEHRRQEINKYHEDFLKENDLPFIYVTGSREERVGQVVRKINQL